MKIKIVLILVATPFLVAFGDDVTVIYQDTTFHQADSSGLPNELAAQTVQKDSVMSQVPEGRSEVKYNRENREKVPFLVCAGMYTIRENAERHIEALKKQGYSSSLKYDGKKEYWVVLKTVKGISKAEKLREQYAKSGITCFLKED